MLEGRGRHADGGEREMAFRGSGPRDRGNQRVP